MNWLVDWLVELVVELAVEDLNDCADQTVNKKVEWMFWGSSRGDLKGLTFFWEKGVGINSERYINQVCPLLYEYCRANPGVIDMQDNAPAHRARITREIISQSLITF